MNRSANFVFLFLLVPHPATLAQKGSCYLGTKVLLSVWRAWRYYEIPITSCVLFISFLLAPVSCAGASRAIKAGYGWQQKIKAI